MFPLGSYPQLLPIIGAPDEVELSGFSEGEIAQAAFILEHVTDKRLDELIEGLGRQIDALRDKDSLYSKLGLYAASKIRDELDAQALVLDDAYPALAPHAAIVGPRFPRDGRDIPVTGRILATTMSADDVKVTDSTGIFGDPYWATVEADSRLAGRQLTMTSGPRKGVSYPITTHVFDGVPYIKVEDRADSIIDTDPGNKFKIDGDGMPQDDLDKWDRGNDWLIVSAIRGTLDGAAGVTLTCMAVFQHGIPSYWLDAEGNAIPGNLAGREIIITGVGTRMIVTHTPAAGNITVDDGTGIVGNEAFSIKARSPAETGKQDRGTLKTGASLEPTCLIRMSPSSIASAGPERAAALTSAMAMIKRYMRLRFHKYRGSLIQLRYLSKNAIAAVDEYEDQKGIADDIRTVSTELGVAIPEPEPSDPPIT
jgi:hypothetical protein